MDAVYLAVVGGIQLLVITIVQWLIRRAEKKEDYARQDAVARKVQDSDKRTQEKLEAIHILVNSDMTEARTAERDALKLLVLSLKQAKAVGARLGIIPGAGEDEEIERWETRILELNQILIDRREAQKKVEQLNGVDA